MLEAVVALWSAASAGSVALLAFGLDSLIEIWGWWWADSVAAIALIPFLLKEGWQNVFPEKRMIKMLSKMSFHLKLRQQDASASEYLR